MSLLDLIHAKDAREDDLAHVTNHRVFFQQLVRNLVNAHEHKGHLSLRPFISPTLFSDFMFYAGPLTVNSQLSLLFESIRMHFFVVLFILILDSIFGRLCHLLVVDTHFLNAFYFAYSSFHCIWIILRS